MFTDTFLSPNQTILVGEDFALHCSIEDDVYAIPNITWRKDNIVVTTGTCKTLVHSLTAKQFSEGGVYQCNVDNGVGKSISESVSVNVQGLYITHLCHCRSVYYFVTSCT